MFSEILGCMYQQIYPIVALGMILSMNAIPSAVTQTLVLMDNRLRFQKC